MNAIRMNTKRINRSFSRAAQQYEELSTLQEDIGRDLLKRVAPGEPAFVLDVGMGTGRLTDCLRSRFPLSKVVGMDLAEGMVGQAKKNYGSFFALQADACALPFADGVFDRIVSNGCYQWAWDLRLAFEHAFRTLAPQGKMAVALFGQNTLRELFETLQSCSSPQSGIGSSMRSLPSLEDVRGIVQNCGFHDVRIEQELRKVHFADMLSLLRWLKATGANVSRTGSFIGRDMLARCAQVYQENYEDNQVVYATFEVIWITGEKND